MIPRSNQVGGARYSFRATGSILFVCAALVISAVTARSSLAQLPDSISSDAGISLLTEYPGEPIYAAFAHSAIRIRDDRVGMDVVFNYGTFDPEQPYFVARFAYGAMDYYVSAYRMDLYMRGAVFENRSVVEQALSMTPDEKAALYERLRTNAQPENRTYRYDFLRDNCSTILLDLLRASVPSLGFDSTGAEPRTYRELLQPYLEHRPFYDLGIDLVLGARVDEEVPYLGRDFLPIELLKILDRADRSEVTTQSGASQPFVASTDTLLWVGRGYPDHKAFPWIAVVLWIVVAGAVIRKEFGSKSPAAGFRADRWLFAVLGLLGLFLAYMWLGTLHYVTDNNWNILWSMPTHLVVVVAWRWLSPSFKQVYFTANAALVAALLLGAYTLPQQLHPAFLPILLFIAWRSWRVAIRLRRLPSGISS